MDTFPLERLLEKNQSVYATCSIVTKRAKQLNAGDKSLVGTMTGKVTSLAIEEVIQGRVCVETKEKKPLK